MTKLDDEMLKKFLESLNMPSISSANSWESVRKEREKILSEEYPVLSSLESCWKALETESELTFGEKDFFRRKEESLEDPIREFMYLIESGVYPPPEILLSIFNCFEVYFSGGGHIELEDVFFGKSKKKQGNEAQRRETNEVYENFDFFYKFRNLHTISENKSLVEMAELFFEKEKDFLFKVPDIDSFLRQYRRWKHKKGSDN